MPNIDQKELDKLNQEVKDKGFVDREHLMNFLALIPTNNAPDIIKEVKNWLEFLHNSADYSNITFPEGDINAILGDLDSYGRVSTDTIMQFKQDSNKAVDQTT